MTNNSEHKMHLSTGGDDPFLPKLLYAINHAKQIDMAVAFIRSTGLNLIYQALLDSLEREPPVVLRLITGDYLEVTEPQALRQLMLLKELGAEIRIHESEKSNSFHMKAYIFVSQSDRDGYSDCAFVGSSNISKMALTDGLEWNLRVDSAENSARFLEIRNKFEQLFSNPCSKALVHEMYELLTIDWRAIHAPLCIPDRLI